ncbi:MAG: GntR family transcriptional regulator [Osedax symbiont Rs2]|nr:MAG: GntR family transcriptional regulator [Osedax symbiont Rs2]
MVAKSKDLVYEHVYEAILEQKLAPGTRLSEESLAEIFDVSRAIVRRSLLKLSHQQVVQLRPNKGAIVASVSIAQSKQIFFARRVVERAIIELAVHNHTAADLQSLIEIVEQEKACFTRGDRSSGIRLSGEFHFKIAEIAANSQLKSFHRSLVPQTSLIIAQYEKRGISHCSYDEHLQLVKVIAAGSVDKAVQLMMCHLDHIEDKLNLDGLASSEDLHQVFSKVKR